MTDFNTLYTGSDLFKDSDAIYGFPAICNSSDSPAFSSGSPSHNYDFQALHNAWLNSKVGVIDSMPGSGKTTAVCQYLQQEQPRRVLFVSPFLSEVEHELPDVKLKGLDFAYPNGGNGGKTQQLKRLLQEGTFLPDGEKSYRTTCSHAAFTRLSPDDYPRLHGYTVIIDETLGVIDKLPDHRRFTSLFLAGLGSVDPVCGLFTLSDPDELAQLMDYDEKGFLKNGGAKDFMYPLANYALTGQLYRSDDSNWFRMLNPGLFASADRVLVMTHGFRGSFMHAWMHHHGMSHAMVDTVQLGLKSDAELRHELASNLIWIDHSRYFRDMNEERNGAPLSIAHYNKLKAAGGLSNMSKSLQNILKKSMKIKANDMFWTAPKAYIPALQKDASLLRGRLTLAKALELPDVDMADMDESDGSDDDAYGSFHSTTKEKENEKKTGKTHTSHLPCNIKASNDYREISNCVYAISMNPPPDVLHMLSDSKADGLDQASMKDTHKLNNFLQFIYRGSIRANRKMQLYCIPDRTRDLAEAFLKG